MTGDTLARIEDSLDHNKNPRYPMERADVLALVNIAKAARDLLESRLWSTEEPGDSWQKANSLAAALAALDEERA